MEPNEDFSARVEKNRTLNKMFNKNKKASSSNKDAREHYVDTIANPVSLERIRSYINADDYSKLKEIYPSGNCMIWGVTPSKINLNNIKPDLSYVSTYEEYRLTTFMLLDNLKKVGIELDIKPGLWSTNWDK